MSGLDDLLGGLLGGKGGGLGDVGDILGQLTGGQGGSTSGSQAGPGGGAGGLIGALLPVLAGVLANGGLGKILDGFQQQGLTAQADSWVSAGDNEPVSRSDVENVLGSDEIAQIAAQLGVSPEQAADALAEVLPQVVDKVSPDGQLPPQADLDSLFETINAAGRGG
jgi:uncharacterized protein YidB (DUF937 family)